MAHVRDIAGGASVAVVDEVVGDPAGPPPALPFNPQQAALAPANDSVARQVAVDAGQQLATALGPTDEVLQSFGAHLTFRGLVARTVTDGRCSAPLTVPR